MESLASLIAPLRDGIYAVTTPIVREPSSIPRCSSGPSRSTPMYGRRRMSERDVWR